MPEIEIILGVFFGGSSLVVGLVVYLARRIADAKFAALREQQRSPVRYTEEGRLVKLAGRIECGDEVLLSPIHQQRCVSWHACVFSPGALGDGGLDQGYPLEVFLDERQTCSFLLRDATGVALVRAKDVAVLIQRKRERPSVPRLPRKIRKENVRALLRRHGQPEYAVNFNWTEDGVLTEGLQVAVLGVARWESGGYRGAPRRLVLNPPPDGGALLISDDPRAMY